MSERPSRSSFQTTRVSPCAEVVQGGFQAGAVGLRAAGDVGVEMFRVAAGGEQGVALQVEALVRGGDAGVSDQHGVSSVARGWGAGIGD